ncbi:MAG: NAD(P)H-dependent oxidoreductase [Terracidiphilus sp.]
MRITILNGEPDAASAFDAYQCALTCRLHALGHTVEKLDLRALDLKGCTGCFNCWIKTPGECSKSDDSATVRRAVMNCDLVLLAAPITMGFTTALLKRAADQMIPLIHPYFVVEGGELHHRARYARYPKFGLLLCATPDTDDEDIEIATAMWRRMARNMKSRLAFATVVDRPAEEVANEIALAA